MGSLFIEWTSRGDIALPFLRVLWCSVYSLNRDLKHTNIYIYIYIVYTLVSASMKFFVVACVEGKLIKNVLLMLDIYLKLKAMVTLEVN